MGIDRHERERRDQSGHRYIDIGKRNPEHRETGKRKKRSSSTLDMRPLQLKIRITARKGMIRTREQLIEVVETIITKKVVPDGVTIHWIDWKKGTGGKANEGRITDEIAAALEQFWNAISHQDAKVRTQRLEAARGTRKARRVSLESGVED